MNDRLDLTGIEVYAKHGVHEHEQTRAQVFKVDVTIYTDLSVPGKTDELSDTVDYSSIALEVREVVGAESNKLIERVATRVVEAIMAHPEVTRSVVTLHKPGAPMDLVFEDVSVTVERSRSSG